MSDVNSVLKFCRENSTAIRSCDREVGDVEFLVVACFVIMQQHDLIITLQAHILHIVHILW